MRVRPLRSVFVVGVLLVLILGGCGGSGDLQNSQNAELASASPMREKVLFHEELIAECMRAEGFEYIAVLPGDLLLEEARAEAERNGEDPIAAVDAVELPDDPNQDILAELSPEELAAYELAYWGPTDVDGCYYSTYEDAWGVDIVDLIAETNDGLAEAEERIAADPRVIDAKSAFVSCVQADGYDVGSLQDIQSYAAKAELEVVREITESGASEVLVTDPRWIEFENEMSDYEASYQACERAYLEVVQPIENEYLGNG